MKMQGGSSSQGACTLAGQALCVLNSRWYAMQQTTTLLTEATWTIDARVLRAALGA
jgi:hypothetical protein